jgi:hypothetical protein
MVFCLVAGLAGCGGSSPATPSGQAAQPAQEQKQEPQAQSSQQGGTWPEWSGPKSLGPGKALPELWYVKFVHFPEGGSLHCYRLSITSEGDYGDAVDNKGKLAAEELAAVKAVLEKVDWEQVPQEADKDYVAYTAFPKSWPPLPDGAYYELKVWLGQTHSSPPYEGRTIVADLKAPCAPEVKEAIDVLKPLQEKYQPELH